MTDQNDQGYLQTVIAQILESSADRASPDGSAPSVQESSTRGTAPAAGGDPDPIGMLLSNPEILTKLPTILSAAKPIMEILGNLNRHEGEGTVGDAAPAMARPQSPSPPPALPKPNTDTRQTALLCALKPYLSPDRQRTVDYMLKLNDLGSVLKALR